MAFCYEIKSATLVNTHSLILDMQNHFLNKKLTSRSDSVHDTSTPSPQGSSPTGAPGGGRANRHVLDLDDPQQCCSGVGAVGSILENTLSLASRVEETPELSSSWSQLPVP